MAPVEKQDFWAENVQFFSAWILQQKTSKSHLMITFLNARLPFFPFLLRLLWLIVTCKGSCKNRSYDTPLLDTSSPPSDISSPSPDCHLISVSPSSPVFLLLVLHLSPSDYIGSHPQNTRMQTHKYKPTHTKLQTHKHKYSILVHILIWMEMNTIHNAMAIIHWDMTNMNKSLFIPCWHCLQNSSTPKWLHSCGVPGEPRRMCPHNTKIRSRNSPSLNSEPPTHPPRVPPYPPWHILSSSESSWAIIIIRSGQPAVKLDL